MKSKKKFSTKIILIIIAVLVIYSFLIGFVNYDIAKKALVEKGKINLKNSVLLASEYIESQYKLVEVGALHEETAIEIIKATLAGPLNEDGSRKLHQNINLGDNGYFIIYNQEGYEVMHPTLEGEYVFDEQDLENVNNYVVRDQIDTALEGGGYTYYSWNFPHSEKIGRKISYVEYLPYWDWIIVATTYEADFIQEAKVILISVSIYSFIFVTLLSVFLLYFIKKVTQPIRSIATGMYNVVYGSYKLIEPLKSSQEIEILVTGYNLMIDSIVTSKEVVDKKTEELAQLAYHDQLTGLPNRMLMKKNITERLSKDQSHGVFVLIDIANLQTINSTMGYKHGDAAIKDLSHFISKIQEKDDLVARTGGNEFSIWLPSKNNIDPYEEVIRLVEAIKNNFISKGYVHLVDIHTVFLINHLHSSETFESIYEKVSTAMHVAKEEKDFGIYCYDDSMKERLAYEISMRTYLIKALKENEFVPYYQKKVDYITEKVVGFEALARWFSPDMGCVSPNVFIPFVTSFNFESKFIDLFLAQVFKDFHLLKENYGEDITISINISPIYFLHSKIKNKMNALLEKYEIPATSIIIEITEDIAIENTTHAAQVIQSLQEIGLKVSIDDFGSGYSSLNYLLTLHPDEIKIDKSIVDQMLTSDKSFYLFKTVCDLADTFGFHIVAEGVETQAQINKIKETTLRTIQGYFYAKPESLETLTKG